MKRTTTKEITVAELLEHINDIMHIINNKPVIDDAFKKALLVNKVHKSVEDRESVEKRLKALEAAVIANKDYLDVGEAAKYLGVSKAEIYYLTSKKKLPYFCPGGKKVYIYKQELNHYISSGHVESVEEAERRLIYEETKNAQSLYASKRKNQV